MAYRRSSDGRGLLSAQNFIFTLSSTVGGGSGTAGLTKTVLEVEGVSVGGATYLRPVLSVGRLCLIGAMSLVTSPLALVFSAVRNSSQFANCSDHEGAAYVLPSFFRTLHREFCTPP